MNQLCGNTAATDARYTGNQLPYAPDQDHYMNANGTTDDTGLTNTGLMTLYMLDKAKERAKTLDTSSPSGTPRSLIRPLTIDGNEFYVAFIHPFSMTDLRTQPAGTNNPIAWFDLQKSVITGDGSKANPILTGAYTIH